MFQLFLKLKKNKIRKTHANKNILSRIFLLALHWQFKGNGAKWSCRLHHHCYSIQVLNHNLILNATLNIEKHNVWKYFTIAYLEHNILCNLMTFFVLKGRNETVKKCRKKKII